VTNIMIDSQFNGPPDSGNGGYCCGMFAAQLELDPGATIEVTLQSPPPLDHPMSTRASGSGIEVLFGETLVATAQAAELAVDYPTPPSLETAIEASKNYSGFQQHPYPECFVCGTARSHGDGLCIYPGPLADLSLVCAPWRPFPALANEQGMLRPEFIWSALDCPSYFGAFIGQDNPKALLGKQCLRILDEQIPFDDDYIITGWPMGREGRKCYGGTGLFNRSGDCLAIARGTWILLKQ
jgi:hypothetical protein